MNKKTYLFFLLLCALAFAACSETEEVSQYDNWQARNEAFIDSIANVYEGQHDGSIKVTNKADSLYRYPDNTTDGGYIYVKKISKDEGSSDEMPFYTSKVNVYYRMSYFTGEVLQKNFSGTAPDNDLDAYTEFTISDLITGWQYALIHMTEGEYWTLYIPYGSAYGSGSSSSSTIEPYSALIYQVKLRDIVER